MESVKYNATVKQVDWENSYCRITVSCDEIASLARPGQFLHIQCGNYFLRRPISIACADKGDLTFVFEVKGNGTKWLSQRSAGDELDVLGPLGNGFPSVEGNILLVGGGIGVPPLYYAALQYPHCSAVLAFRSADRAVLLEPFSHVTESLLLMSDDGSLGKKGYAANGAAKMLERGNYSAVFACGPKIMLRTVAEAAAKAGVPCWVSMEERMGCGVGACLGCAVPIKVDGEKKMLKVCKDGPVFPAEEVIWDG